MQFVDLHRQYLSIKDEVDSAISAVIAKSSFIGGKHVQEFEHSYASLLGVKHCVSCGNGTDALYLALRTMSLRHDEEVRCGALRPFLEKHGCQQLLRHLCHDRC